jgi:hypothetical protein
VRVGERSAPVSKDIASDTPSTAPVYHRASRYDAAHGVPVKYGMHIQYVSAYRILRDVDRVCHRYDAALVCT